MPDHRFIQAGSDSIYDNEVVQDMSQMSDYLENFLINVTLRGSKVEEPITPYVGLYLSNPDDANTGMEVNGGGYKRVPATFKLPTNGSTSNSSVLEFPVATSSWGMVTHVGILSGDNVPTGEGGKGPGHLLYYGQVSTPKVVDAGDQIRIPTGNLTVTLQ